MIEGTIYLQQGDEGPEVRAMQNALLQRGYELPRFGADGIYGQETASAVEQWKRDNSGADEVVPLDPVQDGSYVLQREYDLITALETGPAPMPAPPSGPTRAGSGVGVGAVLLVGAAAGLGVYLARQ